MSASSSCPQYVTDLITLYGAPSQSGFGSAVFYDEIEAKAALEPVALRYYRYFVSHLWEQLGEAAWMSAWKQVYARPSGGKSDIVSELKTIADPTSAQLVPILLSAGDNSEQAQEALLAAYGNPDVIELRVYSIGDGAAMSGLIIAGRYNRGTATFLVFLLD